MSSTRIFNGKLVEASDIAIILKPGEISVDIDQGVLYVHDGVTPGGKSIGGTGQQGGSGQQGAPGVSITNAYVDQYSGNLFFQFSTGNTIGVGDVRGPKGDTGTTEIVFTGTIATGFGLQYNNDGTISVNTAMIQTLLPILEIGQIGGDVTEIDTDTRVHGILSAYALTVTNFIMFPDGTIQTTAGGGGGTGTSTTTNISIGFGLQKNSDGTISINSSSIQTLLPILELTVNNTATTVIDNNTFIQGLLGASALTVTNAVYFPDGTVQTTAGGTGGVSTATVQALIAASLTNLTITGGGNGWELTSGTHVLSLNSAGTVSIPNIFPRSFVAIFDGDHYHIPGGFRAFGGGGGEGGGGFYTATVTFTLVDGEVNTSITPIPNPNNPGYVSGDYFNFTEADHGIPGYVISIEFQNAYTDPVELAVSPPPGLNLGAEVVFPDSSIQTTAFTGTATSLANGGPSVTVDNYGNLTAPGNVSAAGFVTTGSIVIPNNGSAGSIYSQNGLGNIYFNTDNSLLFIITGTYQTSFNADGTTQLGGGYIFPNTQGTQGQVLVYDPAGNGDYKLRWQNGTSIIQSSTAPATTSTSTLWYDTVGGRSYVYFDNSWVDASPIATASATTSTLVNGSYHFTLGVDGTINFDPASNGKGVLQTTADLWFNANGAVYNFGADGSLTFPDNTHQTTAYPGTKIGGAVNIGTTSSNIFIPNTNTQALGLINSLAGVYIEAGTPQKVWQFNTDGTLTLPGSLTGDSVSIQGAPVTITITDTGGVWGGAPGTYTRLNGITPPKWAPANYNPGSDSSITYDGGWQLNNPNFGHPVYVNTGTLFNPSATWDPDVQFGLGSGNPAGAYSYNNWTFGTDGSFTAPGPIYGGVNTIGLATPAPLNLNNTGPVGQVKTQLNLINTAGNAGTGSAIDYFTYVDQGNGLPGARLQAVDDNAYSANFSIALKGKGNTGNNGLTTVWTFGSDGTLTFPDTTVQTTAFTASSYISKATLQSIITTCTNFTEFKNAILGL